MNMHQLRHGVPADLTRTDGEGFYLPPAEEGRVPEASASIEINLLLHSLVQLAVAQAPHGHARKVAVAAVAHALALYGQHDHNEAAARVTRVLPSYADEDVTDEDLHAYVLALISEEG